MTAAVPLAHQFLGQGPPVVLLNGGMMTYASWGTIAERLSARYRLLLFDFRGQLRSLAAGGEAPADLAGHAADLMALLDHVGWSSAHFLGASFGAEVALELAAQEPKRLRSLILVTAMDRETPELRRQGEEMRRVLADGDRRRFWELMVERIYSPRFRKTEAENLAARREQLGVLPEGWFEGVSRLLGALEGFDLTDRLAPRCPALAVLAGDDRVMEASRSRALAAAVGAEVIVHPFAGHALVAEDPEWLAGICLDFLDRQQDPDL